MIRAMNEGRATGDQTPVGAEPTLCSIRPDRVFSAQTQEFMSRVVDKPGPACYVDCALRAN
jgi:hypothetical protein